MARVSGERVSSPACTGECLLKVLLPLSQAWLALSCSALVAMATGQSPRWHLVIPKRKSAMQHPERSKHSSIQHELYLANALRVPEVTLAIRNRAAVPSSWLSWSSGEVNS